MLGALFPYIACWRGDMCIVTPRAGLGAGV